MWPRALCLPQPIVTRLRALPQVCLLVVLLSTVLTMQVCGMESSCSHLDVATASDVRSLATAVSVDALTDMYSENTSSNPASHPCAYCQTPLSPFTEGASVLFVVVLLSTILLGAAPRLRDILLRPTTPPPRSA